MNISKIKTKKTIPWGQTITITELAANPQVVKQLEDSVKATKPSATPEEVREQVYQLVLRDNYYNRLMDLLSSCYEIDFSQAELDDKKSKLIENNPSMEKETAAIVARLNTIRELIYADLAKELNLSITDDQVKATLEDYYQKTGQPIREFLVNRPRFEEVKRTLLDQVISDRILNGFKPNFQLDEFNKRMAEQQANMNSNKNN